MGRVPPLFASFASEVERLLGLLRENLLTVAVAAGLFALATTPIAFAVLGRMGWFQARRGRTVQRPAFWSVVCSMLLVMGLPTIFCLIAIWSGRYDPSRYEFDPNRVPSVLEQGRRFEAAKDRLAAVEQADAAVKAEMERLAGERKALQDAVKTLDGSMLALGQAAATSPAAAEALPRVVEAMGAVRGSVGVDAPPAWKELAALLNDPARLRAVQAAAAPAPVVIAAAPGAAPAGGASPAAAPARPRNGVPAPALASEMAAVPPAQQAVAKLLPLDDIPEGWEAVAVSGKHFQTFPADTMYELIDGRAESFLQYDATGLAYTYFRPAGDDSGEVQLYAYEFASPLKAFGKYGSEKPGEAETVAVGSEGYASAGSVSFHQGKYFVQVVSTSADAKFASFALELAKRVADRAAGKAPAAAAEAAPPAAAPVASADDPTALFQLLPAEMGRKAPQYVARDVFGYSFLSDVFLADYENEGATWQGFLRPCGSADEAKALFDRYADNAKTDGATVAELAIEGADRAVAIDNPSIGLFDVIVLKGNVVAGANGAPARAPAEAFARVLARGLPASIAWSGGGAAAEGGGEGENAGGEAGEP